MNEYLVFETEAEAKIALEIIYANMVGAIYSSDLENVATGEVVEKDDLTPDEAVKIDATNRHYPVFGVNAATGTKDNKEGYTTAWAVAQETIDGKWVFPKPTNELMEGLNGCKVMEFNQGWFQNSQTNG